LKTQKRASYVEKFGGGGADLKGSRGISGVKRYTESGRTEKILWV
jgi:hypothetical protein